jgi:hypothetical protein
MTRHFDKLMACAIAWQLRDEAKPNIDTEKQQQVLQIRRERQNEFFEK